MKHTDKEIAGAARREELSQKIREELERRRHVEDIALDRIARNDHAGAIEILEGLDDSIIEGLHREYMDLLKDER